MAVIEEIKGTQKFIGNWIKTEDVRAFAEAYRRAVCRCSPQMKEFQLKYDSHSKAPMCMNCALFYIHFPVFDEAKK